ncbi:MAG: hypothetical protein Q7K42_05350 [Candidatus Diapherotrites archaeon]|nr:hypothetical protein [Candidatus Diapherotrites archaeon]
MKLNSRGQEFESFELMIGMIIAFFILLIILGAITYFDGLKSNISQETMVESFKAAYNSPNADVILRRDLIIKQGAYSRNLFSNATGLPNECIQFVFPEFYSVLSLSDSGNTLFVDGDLTENVYFQCVNQSNDKSLQGCEISCYVSLGHDPSIPN